MQKHPLTSSGVMALTSCLVVIGMTACSDKHPKLEPGIHAVFSKQCESMEYPAKICDCLITGILKRHSQEDYLSVAFGKTQASPQFLADVQEIGHQCFKEAGY